VPRQHRRIGVEVDRPLVLASRCPEPATHVTSMTGWPAARMIVTASTAAPSARSKPASPSASQPEPAWKWTVSIVRSCRRAAVSASSSRSSPIRTRRPVAGVLEVLVVAGTRAGIDPQAMTDPRARRPYRSTWLDRIEIEVDPSGQQAVEIALGDVVAV